MGGMSGRDILGDEPYLKIIAARQIGMQVPGPLTSTCGQHAPFQRSLLVSVPLHEKILLFVDLAIART